MNTEKLRQIQLPAPEDFDPSPPLCCSMDAVFTPARPSMRSFRMDGGRSP